MAVLVYYGYVLETAKDGYQSKINGRVLKFDTAGMWKEYIDYIKFGKNGKSK